MHEILCFFVEFMFGFHVLLGLFLEVVEDVVLFEGELEQDYSHWPDVRFVVLFLMAQEGFDGHVGFGSYFVPAYALEAF